MSISLAKMERPSLAEEAARHIQNFILSNKLKVGDLLPGELEFSSRLGISRPVVREALGKLQHVGLTQPRKHRGTVVNRPDPTTLLDNVFPFLTDNPTFVRDITALRYILEIGAVELAIANAKEEDTRRIKHAAIEHKKAVDSAMRHADIHAADIGFHQAIFDATGNGFMSALSSVIAKHFSTHDAVHPRKGHHNRVVRGHFSILQAIEMRDVDKAVQLMRKHLRGAP